MLQGKFRFSLDGVDATARQFAEIRRQLLELSASAGKSIRRLGGRVAAVEHGFESLESGRSQADAGGDNVVVAPSYGGTGVRSVFDTSLSLTPLRPVYCLDDGMLGVDCSSVSSVANVVDADEIIPLDSFRRVKWKVYFLKDDLNSKLDDAQPVVGLLVEDLDDAGLGFFCEYDGDGVPTGVNYSKLSVAALRLVQEALDEVDELREDVKRLSGEVGRMKETHVKKSTVGE